MCEPKPEWMECSRKSPWAGNASIQWGGGTGVAWGSSGHRLETGLRDAGQSAQRLHRSPGLVS